MQHLPDILTTTMRGRRRRSAEASLSTSSTTTTTTTSSSAVAAAVEAQTEALRTYLSPSYSETSAAFPASSPSSSFVSTWPAAVASSSSSSSALVAFRAPQSSSSTSAAGHQTTPTAAVTRTPTVSVWLDFFYLGSKKLEKARKSSARTEARTTQYTHALETKDIVTGVNSTPFQKKVLRCGKLSSPHRHMSSSGINSSSASASISNIVLIIVSSS